MIIMRAETGGQRFLSTGVVCSLEGELGSCVWHLSETAGVGDEAIYKTSSRRGELECGTEPG